VEIDVETLRPTYKLHIGQFGMSNALKIARRLKLPKELLKKAHKYLKRRKGKTGELVRLQELRIEAEKAKTDALAAQVEAAKQKDEYERKVAAVQREQTLLAEQNARREKLKAGEAVHVRRFDAMGKVVRVDVKKQTILVSLGLGQWEIPFEEVTPQD
jgi:DNA mismatch repair protein MutS2